MSLYSNILNCVVNLRMNLLFVMNQEKNSLPLSFKKITMLICSAIFLIAILFSFSSGDTNTVQANTGDNTENTESSILSHDTDGDGLSDVLEDLLDTDATNKYGDKDQDGLYDFEEYLDYYGTPDNTADTPKYSYNDSSTHGDILDIYDKFGFESNKTDYLRDTVFIEEIGGFTNYLLWNVTFNESYGGGSRFGSVNYINNTLINVTFDGRYAGGSEYSAVRYINNTLTNVTFSGQLAGGSEEGTVSYMNNSLTNVTFSGWYVGGSWRRTVSYMGNSLTNVTFSGGRAGGSISGDVSYMGNSLTNVTFSGGRAGGSRDGTVAYVNNGFINVQYFNSSSEGNSGVSVTEHTNYTNNIFDRVQFAQLEGGREEYDMTLTGNSIITDSYDSDGDGVGDIFEFLNEMDPEDSDSDGDGLNDGWEVKYNGSFGVDPLVPASDLELNSDIDMDHLSLSEEEDANTDPETDPEDGDSDGDGLTDDYEVGVGLNANNIDTDGDGLNDGWEVKYNGSSGVNPLVPASVSELNSDIDIDSLSLSEEEDANTDPEHVDTDRDGLTDGYEVGVGLNASNLDTDDDGLNDGWEVKYNGSSGVDPLVPASISELNSDIDIDDLSLSGEEDANTDPEHVDTDRDGLTDGYEVGVGLNASNLDTDDDGLNDAWEVKYDRSFGVDPLIPASISELNSDIDIDGLSLSEEEELGTDPENGDSDGDGLTDGYEVEVELNANSIDTDGDGLNDGWEVKYNGSSGVNPLVPASVSELNSDIDIDGLSLSEEEDANTDPEHVDTDRDRLTDSYEVGVGLNASNLDTDDDGLNDGWEVKYDRSSGVDPLVPASISELNSDIDIDGLSLSEEEDANTDPEHVDTDRDGLTDGYEVGVGLNASNLDTDDDGLNDAWEVKYDRSFGVDPLIPASISELNSDIDIDGLSLSEEEELGTDSGDSDTDDDGLNDGLEYTLETNATDKYGDKDQDGLYDFEEYLDLYGTPDNSMDTTKYSYNDSSTYGDVLDIYDKFGFDSNKAGYLRDTVFTEQNGGFTNYLLWNVTFSSLYAGGSQDGSVSYMNNTLIDVTFSGLFAGGSLTGAVNYTNNNLTDVTFSNNYAGGSFEESVRYINNTLTDVTFSGGRAGGSWDSTVRYINNTLTDVTFSGDRAGGGQWGVVSYINNTLTNVIFSDLYTGGAHFGSVHYINNTLTNVTFSGSYAGGSEYGAVSYINNILTNVIFNGDSAGGSVDNTVLYESNRFSNVQYIKTLYYGRMLGDSGVSASGHTNYTNNIFDRVQFAQLEGRRDEYNVISIGITIITDFYDTDSDGVGDIFEFLNGMEPEHSDSDGDGLNDAWEVNYTASSGVDPLVAASDSELHSDADVDDLSLSEEEEFGTDPEASDTDGDGLNDSWEVMYDESSGVDPLVNASASELGFDADMDGLNLSEEEEANTDPEHEDTDRDGLNDSYEVKKGLNASNLDTDGDGLNDGWEMKYNGSPAINPLSVAFASDLNSDTDDDGLSLLEEEEHGTNPGKSDTDSDELNDGWEVKYNGSSGVNPLSAASKSDLNSDADKDGFILSREEELGTDPGNRDTDRDGLSDSWEVRYNGSSGVDPLSTASNSELNSDADGDGLSLSEEEKYGADPENRDTDGDGLNDGWEVKYTRSSGVNLFSTASNSELNSDADGDGLSLSEEEEHGTDPEDSDTDKDGLNDRWEVKYKEYSGVDPLSVVFESDLKSDVDMDGLSLSEEEEHGTDPGNADMDGDGLNDGWEVEYAGSPGVDPLSAASESDLKSDVDKDGFILSEEEEANTNPELANSVDINTTSSGMTSSTNNNPQTSSASEQLSESSSSSSFILIVLIIVLIIVVVVFIILGIMVFIVRVKKQIT